ncbi:MAG: penicillin-binding protein, partial [bacterium]|nr:penicillin-binding protein [bacterium]
KEKKFVWIKRRISEEESRALQSLGLEGIGTLPEYKRFYPNGNLAANLIGAVGYDAKALSGLELTWDKVLKSEDPPLLVEQDAKGRSYAPYALVGLERPKQIVLSIDKTIQYITQRELSKAVEKAKAKGGVALVLKADTGEILAMAAAPTFDPNRYFDFKFNRWRNRAITDQFEPGSTFKAITAATALETGVLQPEAKIHCENGAMKVGKSVIHDHHGHGLLKLPEIIKYSSNICSYKIAHKIGKKRFHEYITSFGFGQKTGIEAPGEQAGLLASPKHMSSVQLGTIGFGQGISSTPLQMLMAYGALANGGKLMKPLLVKEVQDSEGNTLERHTPTMIKQVLREDTAQETIKLLETVVQKGGTGTQAALKNYDVAGKTGTAQKVQPGEKGYAKNKYVASFIGLAPAKNPKLVVLVSIDEPQGAYYGGTVSGPVFREIMGSSLAYLKVPPDRSGPSLPPAKIAKKPAPKKPGDAKKDEKIPPLKGGKDVWVAAALTGSPEGLKPIPDLKGLTVREAMRRALAQKFKIEIQGTGVCHSQEPAAGETAHEGTEIILECKPPS